MRRILNQEKKKTKQIRKSYNGKKKKYKKSVLKKREHEN